MANPGPASSSLPTYPLLCNNQALVCVAYAKGVNLSTAGDTPVYTVGPMPNFVPTTVVTCNSSGTTVNIAAATVGIYTAPGQGGTAVLTTAALTGQTTAAFAYVRAATAAAAMVTLGSEAPLYINIGTTVAGGVTDIYLYGYNVS